MIKFTEMAIKKIVDDMKETIENQIKWHGLELIDLDTYTKYIQEIYDGDYSLMKNDVEYMLIQLLNSLPEDNKIGLMDDLEIWEEDGEIVSYKQLMKKVRNNLFKNGLSLDLDEE